MTIKLIRSFLAVDSSDIVINNCGVHLKMCDEQKPEPDCATA